MKSIKTILSFSAIFLSFNGFALDFIPHEILKNDVLQVLKTDLMNQCPGFENEILEVTKFSSEIVDDLDPGYSDETIKIEFASKISDIKIETMLIREIQNPSNRLMTYRVFLKVFDEDTSLCYLQ